MRRILVFVALLVFLPFPHGFSQQSVFDSHSGENKWIAYQDNHRALYRILLNEAIQQLDKRADNISKIRTVEEWSNYQRDIKGSIGASLEKFERTPLNPRVTGILERENFIVEKIIFESHPQFYVTGCLFIPKKREDPAPTVIYCSGHSGTGFRSEAYQRAIINLVEKGFIVFAYDPIGQGERLQYMDDMTGKSKIGGPTTEHSYAGVQILLTGTSLSDYFIWDGVRAIDFLATRTEVDMKRIGITGRSGGGTQSAMIAAHDERILASAPECYITTFKRLLQSIGAQDAEQNPYMAIKNGIDIPDLLHVRAPKPTLIVTTTNDFFSQQGAREAFSEVKKSYTAMGSPNHIQFSEDMGGHQSTTKNREAMYSFFQEFLNLPGSNKDQDITPFTEEELRVIPTGQIGSSLKGNTVFDLNQKYFSKTNISKDLFVGKVKEIAGIDFERKLTGSVYTGKFLIDETEIEKYFVENDKNDFALPIYVIKKRESKPENLIIWNHPAGKEKLLEDPLLPGILNSGFVVITADLPGIGELFEQDFKGDGFVQKVPFNYTFLANLIGKSIPGIQAEAIDLLMQFIEGHEEFHGKKIDALVQDNSIFAFLHFTVLKNKFQNIAIVNPPKPDDHLLKTRYYDPLLAYNIVPGSLSFYTLEEMMDQLSDTSIKIIDLKSNKPIKSNHESEIIDILQNYLHLQQHH